MGVLYLVAMVGIIIYCFKVLKPRQAMKYAQMGITCPYCGSSNCNKVGKFIIGSHSSIGKNFKCNICGAKF